jgi:hypothetical protein
LHQVAYNGTDDKEVYTEQELVEMLLPPGHGDDETPRHFTRDTWAVQTKHFRAEALTREGGSPTWGLVHRTVGDGHPENWGCSSCKETSIEPTCIHIRQAQTLVQPWNGWSLETPLPEESEELKLLPGPFRRVFEVYVLDGHFDGKPIASGYYPGWKSWSTAKGFALTLAVLSDFHGDIRCVTGLCAGWVCLVSLQNIFALPNLYDLA